MTRDLGEPGVRLALDGLFADRHESGERASHVENDPVVPGRKP